MTPSTDKVLPPEPESDGDKLLKLDVWKICDEVLMVRIECDSGRCDWKACREANWRWEGILK